MIFEAGLVFLVCVRSEEVERQSEQIMYDYPNTVLIEDGRSISTGRAIAMAAGALRKYGCQTSHLDCSSD
jgi:hypothetical protein